MAQEHKLPQGANKTLGSLSFCEKHLCQGGTTRETKNRRYAIKKISPIVGIRDRADFELEHPIKRAVRKGAVVYYHR